MCKIIVCFITNVIYSDILKQLQRPFSLVNCNQLWKTIVHCIRNIIYPEQLEIIAQIYKEHFNWRNCDQMCKIIVCFITNVIYSETIIVKQLQRLC